MGNFKLESPQSMRNRNTQDNFLKGIAKAITEFADVKAEKSKIQGQILINDLKEKSNIFYKLEEQAKRNQMAEEFVKRQREEQGVNNYNIESPELRINENAEVKPYYLTAKDKELRIRMGLNQIRNKEQKYAQTGDEKFKLTDREQAFKDSWENSNGAIAEDTKGLSIDTGGKLAMVKQAKNDIDEVRNMLFPDGTPKSFNRGRAFASNIPGSRTPIIGAVIPQAMPFNEMGQKIYSRLQNAVAAKLRVETGATANPGEIENILGRFGVTTFSDPKAAWDALNRLEEFMNTTIDITDPHQKFATAGGTRNMQDLVSPIKHKVGDIIRGKNGKYYRITGGNPDDPDVEEIK